MKAILSKLRPDGTYADCGMNTRTVINARSKGAAIVTAHKIGFTPCRIELFSPNFYAEPMEVIYV